MFRANGSDSLSNSNVGGSFHAVIQINKWADSSGGRVHQMAFGDNNTVWTRVSNSACTNWESWKQLGGGSDSDSSTLTETLISSGSLANLTTGGKLYYSGGSNNVSNKPSGVDAFGMFNIRSADGYMGQLLISSNQNTGIYWRVGNNSSLSSASWYEIWHTGNDGSGSGLDADLLDGTHKSGLLTAASSSNATNLSITVGGTTKTIPSVYADYLGGTTKAGLFSSMSYSSNKLNITIGGTTKSVTINPTLGDVEFSSMTINGALTVSGKATFNTQSVHNYGILTSNIDVNGGAYFYYNGTQVSRIMATWTTGVRWRVLDTDVLELGKTSVSVGGDNLNGSVDLGRTARRWKTVYSVNALNTSSDIRLKNVVGDIALTAEQVAKAPAFLYRWKNGRDKTLHAGGSAQYWQKVLPAAVLKGEDGYFSMEYDRIAYAAVISLARETESIEERVTRLESENVELKAKIEEYERLNRQRTIRTDILDVTVDS